LADYRNHYGEIRAGGAQLVAVSVDPPDRSQALRQQLDLPFPILCDTSRRVVREWHIYNPREHGGIAQPAVFIIDPDRRVRYGTVDSVSKRTSAAESLRALSSREIVNLQRKRYIPQMRDWFRALRNLLRR